MVLPKSESVKIDEKSVISLEEVKHSELPLIIHVTTWYVWVCISQR